MYDEEKDLAKRADGGMTLRTRGGRSGYEGWSGNIIFKMSKIEFNTADFKTSEADTGSADYQIALLTERIIGLTDHLKTHKKDASSRRGLLRLVARRRKLLDYTRGKSEERYQKLIAGLGLRR